MQEADGVVRRTPRQKDRKKDAEQKERKRDAGRDQQIKRKMPPEREGKTAQR